MKRSLEQICRDILERAVAEGLVIKSRHRHPNPDPQCLTAGDLTGVANFLAQLLRENRDG